MSLPEDKLERWCDVLREVHTVERYLGKSLSLFAEIESEINNANKDEDREHTLVLAFQHALQRGYASVEVILKRIFVMHQEPVPEGEMWRQDCLMKAFEATSHRVAIFSAQFKDDMDILRGFQHVAAHSYDDFSFRLAVPVAESVKRILPEFRVTLERFIAKQEDVEFPAGVENDTHEICTKSRDGVN